MFSGLLCFLTFLEDPIRFLNLHARRQPGLPLHIILPAIPIPIRILFNGPMDAVLPEMLYAVVCHNPVVTPILRLRQARK